MSKRRQRRQPAQPESESKPETEQPRHVIIARGSGTWTNPLIRCSCEAKINDGIKLTADELFQIHRESAG
jgi:hypothetical protein